MNLEVVWHGAPKPVALVLLHDGLGCARTWDSVAPLLTAACGLPALAYSRPGYGASPLRTAPFAPAVLEHEAREVLPSVLMKERVERALLVGHSDGATVALLHATTLAGRGALGVVAIAPHVMREAVTVEGIERLLEQRSALVAGLGRMHGERADGVLADWSTGWLERFQDWSIVEELTGIRCPVLLVQGDRDPFGTRAQLDAIRRQVRTPCEAHELAGCGHSPLRERREATVAMIAAFAQTLVQREDEAHK